MAKVVANEKEFHDSRFGSASDPRSSASKYYAVATKARDYFQGQIAKYAEPGSQLLEYGCGTGGAVDFFCNCGYVVTGIDISEEGIKKAKEKVRIASMPVRYLVADAEKTGFEDATYDVIQGSGILHHLHIKNALNELRRILRPEGHAIFFEPLGHNPVINLYRALTPSMRSQDEHPLQMSDIRLMQEYFSKVEVRYFCLFSLLAVPFRKTALFNVVRKSLEKFDSACMRVIPPLKKYAWIVVIDLSAPKRK